jgi:transposase
MDNRSDYPPEWAAFTAISKLLGMSPETLKTWIRKTQVDTGSRPRITSDERARLKQLEHCAHPLEPKTLHLSGPMNWQHGG